MAEIVIKVNTEGGEKSLKNINDLKSAIGELEKEAANMDLGSDAFENQKNQIDELKKKYQELSKSQQQLDAETAQAAGEAASKRAEHMEKIGNNLQKFAAGITDAFAGAFIAFGAGEEDAKAFNDTLQKGLGIAIGVKGGIEALVAGVQLAGPAFEAFNAVMAANPVGAVVVAVAALAAGIYLLINALDDENETLEKQNDLIIENAKKQRDALTDKYDTEIAKAQAAGKNTAEIEEQKRIEILKTLQTQLDAIMSTAKANGEYTAEQIKQIEELGKTAAKIENDAAISKIKAEKDASDAQDKANTDAKAKRDQAAAERIASNKRLIDQIAQANIAAIKDDEARAIAMAEFNKRKRDEDIRDSKASASVKAEALVASQTSLNTELAKINKDFRDKDVAEAKKTADEIAKTNDRIKNDKQQAMRDSAMADEIINKHSAESRLNTLKVNYEIELEEAENNAEKKRLIEAKYAEDVANINNEIAAKTRASTIASINATASAVEAAFSRMDSAAGNLGASIVSNLGNAFKVMSDDAATKTDKVIAGLDALNGILNAINSYQNQMAAERVASNEAELNTKLENLNASKENELAVLEQNNAAQLDNENLTAEQKNDINNSYNAKKKQIEYDAAMAEYALKLSTYKADTEVKKKAFETDKKLRIASTIISTISGALQAYVGMLSLGPYGPIAGALSAAAVVALGAVQVSQISSTKFDAGTPPAAPKIQPPNTNDNSGDNGGPSTSAQSGPQLYATGGGDTNTGQGGQGQRQSQQPIKAYVVSQEVTSSQNMNNVIERRSSF